jgi:transposase-like protein/IS1 family transposase
MVVSSCDHRSYKKNGLDRHGIQRYKCCLCGKRWSDEKAKPLRTMRIGMELAERIVKCLCEGNSVRGTARLTGTDPHTIIDLLLLVGRKCEEWMARTIKDVHVDDVQMDEIWQFIFCKRYTAKNSKYVGGCGDSYCYTAIERNTKLLIAWHLGRRNEADTHEFCRKVNDATIGPFHLSSDGWNAYPFAVFRRIGKRVDYGQLIKTYQEPVKEERRKYSPSRIIGAEKQWIMGNPDMDRVCTSHAERMNGTIRNFCKRMGRLTYCFSKRWANHQAALGLFFAHYNFCRRHRTLGKITPAMAHGLTHYVWTVRELLETVLRSGNETAPQ